MTHELKDRIKKAAHSALLKSAGEERPDRPALYVCGLNHASAPIELRERYALAPEEAERLTRELARQGLSRQLMILSTCNRTELYAFSKRPGFALELREAFLSIGRAGESEAAALPLQEFEGVDAARHLFGVGAGLDSLILGENQIKAQLHQAYETSRAAGASGRDLHRLVEAAHRAGKRIRSETDLNVGTLCVGKAAVLKGEHVLGSLEGKVCLVIGAGKVGRMAARAIAERRPGRLWIVNRTKEKAEEVAADLGAEAFALSSLSCLLPEAEFILGAAYAPELILDLAVYEHFAPAGRRPARVCVVDAAVPRILEPAIGQLDGVELFDIEHMQEITEENRRRRAEAAQQAWRIVEEEVRKHQASLKASELAPIIQAMHGQVDRIFSEELAGIGAQLTPELTEKIEAMNRRVKQRLMHEVIQELKAKVFEG